MKTKIIDKVEIKLNETQNKMLISGWGREVFEEVTVEKITYLSDGLKVKGYIAYPKKIYQRNKYPSIIWNRGGYGDKGAIDSFNARGIFGQIASWGYVVFASQYRGNAGSEGREELGGSDVNDIINLIPLANEFPFADKDNWGMEGWSRGGMMTLLALLKKPDFKCAILSGAISNIKEIADINEQQKNYYENILGIDRLNLEMEKRTILNFADKLPDIPYLILHGSTDKTVPAIQSIKFAEKLQEMNYTYRLIIFESGDHYLKMHRKEVDQVRKMWFDKYLH